MGKICWFVFVCMCIVAVSMWTVGIQVIQSRECRVWSLSIQYSKKKLSFPESKNSKQLYHVCTTVTAIYRTTYLTEPIKLERIFRVPNRCIQVFSDQIITGPIKQGMIWLIDDLCCISLFVYTSWSTSKTLPITAQSARGYCHCSIQIVLPTNSIFQMHEEFFFPI